MRKMKHAYNTFKLPLVEQLYGSFECTDLGFSLIDAEFYAIVDGVIFKIDIWHFFKICPFFKCIRPNNCK